MERIFRILLVDDEKGIAEGLKILLEDMNRPWKVVGIAENGKLGMEMAKQLMADIVVTDVRMPIMDGIEMVRTMKQKGIHAMFVVLSGYADFTYAKQAVALGVKAYVTKPVDEEELEAALVSICGEIRENERKSVVFSAETAAQALEEGVGQKDKERCHTVIHRYFSGIHHIRMEELPGIQRQCQNMILCSIRTVPSMKDKLFEFLGKNVLSMEQISRLMTLEQLENWMINCLDAILLLMEPEQNREPVDEIREYIEKNYHKEISLAELAERFYLNPYYVSQLFKKKTGVTYQKYVTDLRISHAKRYLEETDKMIYEISELVGYSDTVYFSRIFEKNTGLRPSDYRKKIRGSENE